MLLCQWARHVCVLDPRSTCLTLLTFVRRPLASAHENNDDADDEHHDDSADDDRDDDHQVVVLQPLPPAQVACKQTRGRSHIAHNNLVN